MKNLSQRLIIALMVMTTWCIVETVSATELYHTNRTFTPVQFDIQGNPTLYELNTNADKLTGIVKGTNIVIDTTNTYAIEKQAAIALGYSSATSAWNAVVIYNGTSSNYPGKIYDNVGWARGTKNTVGGWGAYLWIIQNQIAFQSSTSEWWTTTNGVPVVITNVFVGSLGNYGPMSNVVDIGPHLDAATNNYPGADQGETNEYRADWTNVFYQLSIPDIWIMPREAVRCVGGSNVQYTVTGTNITNGVTWTLNPTNFEGHAVLQTNVNWHYASVTPGNVTTNYKIRATSKDNTNFYDEVNLSVVGLQSPLQYKIGTNTWADMPDPLYACKDATVDFKAIKIPADAAWPTNKPAWTFEGQSGGTGTETNSHVFATYSTNATDYKLTTAECGNIVTGKVIVGGIRKIPLGGSTNLSSIMIGKVYIPTKWGGLNTIAGGYAELFYTDGSDLSNDIATKIINGEMNDKRVAQGDPCVYTVPANQYRWYYVRVSNNDLVLVSNSFVQSHTVSKTPWTCPWYPMSDEQSPNLYDSNECLERYDTAYGTSSTNQERINIWINGDYVAKNTLDEQDAERTLGYDFDNADSDNDVWTGWATNFAYDIWNNTQNSLGQDGYTNDTGDVSWWGHCDMATAVIICENEPSGNHTTNGVVFTPELKKGLLVALYHNFEYLYDSGTNVLPHIWHKTLEDRVVGSNTMVGCDVYCADPGNDEQVWNYPVYEITKAEYKEKPGQTNEKTVEVKCELKYWNNGTASLYYWYNIIYNNDGIAFSSSDDDWMEHPSASENKKRPDVIWMPKIKTSVDAFWGGQLNYSVIRGIVPEP